jgi:hypothetical protein
MASAATGWHACAVPEKLVIRTRDELAELWLLWCVDADPS